MKKIAVVVAIIGVFCQSVLAQDFEYSFMEEYPATDSYSLKIKSFDGSIKVSPSNTNKVQIYYIVKKGNNVQEIDRQMLEEEVDLSVESAPGKLDILVEQNRIKNVFTDWMDSYSVSFKIYVPENTATDLNASDGSISVSGLKGSQLLRSSDGSLKISDIVGSIDGRTSDGSIKMENTDGETKLVTSDGSISIINTKGNRMDMVTSDGSIKLSNVLANNIDAKTSDGSITLNEVTGVILLRTSDGSINFEDITGSLEAVTSDGSIRGSISKLDGNLILRTNDGSVTASIPSNLGLDLKLKGDRINMPELENFTGKADRESVYGKINGGGILVDLSTSDGSVTLQY